MGFRSSATLLVATACLPGSLGACGSAEPANSALTASAEGGGTDAGSGEDGSAAGNTDGGGETAASDGSAEDGDSGGIGDAGHQSPGDSEAGDSATRACDTVQCLRAIQCVTSCGGAVTYTGCCPCSAPAFDEVTCADGGFFGCTADAAGNAMCGGARPPHFYRCVVPYKQPPTCQALSVGNATDTYCCP